MAQMQLECINLLIKKKFRKSLNLDTKLMFILFLELRESNIGTNLKNAEVYFQNVKVEILMMLKLVQNKFIP